MKIRQLRTEAQQLKAQPKPEEIPIVEPADILDNVQISPLLRK